MRNYLLFLLFSPLLFLSCDKVGSIIIISDQTEFLPMTYFGECYYGAIISQLDEVVVRNEAEYAALADSMYMEKAGLNCSQSELPAINFNLYSLIGKKCSIGGCDAEFGKKIERYSTQKKIVYTLSPSYIGYCSMLIMDMNWALIPKIDDDFQVEFIVEESFVIE